MSGTPLAYLSASGERAATIVPLTWALFSISVIVIVTIGLLLWLSVRRRPSRTRNPRDIGIVRARGGVRLVIVGLSISLVPLLIALVWTMIALARIGPTPRRAGIDIAVTAHQWWWQADYLATEPDRNFSTANEIHIPVGVPVRISLASDNVIHSFWVPQLTGKTDVIPGQINQSWMIADHPGRYYGQCAEFCGLQHAHMAFTVVADRADDFESWRRQQLQTAPPPKSPAQRRGLALVEFRCAMCHSIRGTSARSNAAPDLTHLKSRAMIGAGTLPNTPGSLAGWIQNPQGPKPAAMMPAQMLSGTDLNDLLAYLETLK